MQESVEVQQLHESALVGVTRKRVILLFLSTQIRKIQRFWKRTIQTGVLTDTLQAFGTMCGGMQPAR